jgi:hypothetical protein
MLIRRYAHLLRHAHVHHANLPQNTHSILYKQPETSTILRDIVPIILSKLDTRTDVKIVSHTNSANSNFLYHGESAFLYDHMNAMRNIKEATEFLTRIGDTLPQYPTHIHSTNHFINVFCREEFYQRMMYYRLIKKLKL